MPKSAGLPRPIPLSKAACAIYDQVAYLAANGGDLEIALHRVMMLVGSRRRPVQEALAHACDESLQAPGDRTAEYVRRLLASTLATGLFHQ